MSIKSSCKAILHRFGVDVVRYLPDVFLPPFDILPIFFKMYLKDYLEANPDFFFIQVGANDGIDMDPIRSSILAYHLRGLLIEPLPDIFSTLRKNYQSEPQLLFENSAIADQPGRLPLFRVKPGQGLDWWQALATFDKKLLLSKGVPEEIIEENFVETVTFKSLLDKHGIKSVNLLQVDTEGHDYKIVKSALESGLRPDIINYEFYNLSRADQVKCKRMLFDIGYRFIDIGIDTLCVLPTKLRIL